MKKLLFRMAVFVAAIAVTNGAEPKRLLVVGATASFRHPSVENAEKMIGLLAEKSGGQFTAIFMSASPDYPKYPAPGPRGGGGRGGPPSFAGQVADATPEQQAAISALGNSLAAATQAASAARTAFATAVYSRNPDPVDIKAKSDALAAAELVAATARAEGLTQLQATSNRQNVGRRR